MIFVSYFSMISSTVNLGIENYLGTDSKLIAELQVFTIWCFRCANNSFTMSVLKSQIQNDINIMHFLNFISKIIFLTNDNFVLSIFFFFLMLIVVFIKLLNWIKSFWNGLCLFIQYLRSNCFICTKKIKIQKNTSFNF